METKLTWIDAKIASPKQSGVYYVITLYTYEGDPNCTSLEYDRDRDGWNLYEGSREHEMFPLYWAYIKEFPKEGDA